MRSNFHLNVIWLKLRPKGSQPRICGRSFSQSTNNSRTLTDMRRRDQHGSLPQHNHAPSPGLMMLQVVSQAYLNLSRLSIRPQPYFFRHATHGSQEYRIISLHRDCLATSLSLCMDCQRAVKERPAEKTGRARSRSESR